MERDFWRHRRVFLTGHTGFKGGWMVLWLHHLQARVSAYSLPPNTVPSLFEVCGVGEGIESLTGDINDAETLAEAMASCQPTIAFHFAAQPLVRRSYGNAPLTFRTNVIGTVNFLEAVRAASSIRAAVIVTSDKCYEPRQGVAGYSEGDVLGGSDPYSASKACAELVAASYRESFFAESNSTQIATVRAGNVIGGGDWAEDRLVPDAIKALSAGRDLAVRNRGFIRPWQHVMEPLAGYLALAERLCDGTGAWSSSWNFGPQNRSVATVAVIADKICAAWGNGLWHSGEEYSGLKETGVLRLDSSKARRLLGWSSRLSLDESVATTVDWYRAHLAKPAVDMRKFTTSQISSYEERLSSSSHQGALKADSDF
jgi:CDP-glucose 4,6-dehydratase